MYIVLSDQKVSPKRFIVAYSTPFLLQTLTFNSSAAASDQFYPVFGSSGIDNDMAGCSTELL